VQLRYNKEARQGQSRDEELSIRADFAAAGAVLRAASDIEKCGIHGPLGALERLQVKQCRVHRRGVFIPKRS